MLKKLVQKYTLIILLVIQPFVTVFEVAAQSADKESDFQLVHELHYLEREPGVDDFEVTMLVSDRYIRIDEIGDDSGFIVYDDEEKVIYSVSNFDKSVLVIKEHHFTAKDSPAEFKLEYLQLSDAPPVSGNSVFNYRAYSGEGTAEETCMEVQLVENLLPEVRVLLKNYQKVVSGQQVKMVDNKITDVQTACYFVDQIYNTGAYYEKGLPIQEWHSNERSKILTSFKKVTVDKDKFNVPDSYNQFSIDKESKIQIR